MPDLAEAADVIRGDRLEFLGIDPGDRPECAIVNFCNGSDPRPFWTDPQPGYPAVIPTHSSLGRSARAQLWLGRLGAI
ncbi:MAG: hypothetical protein EA001_14260 [Oscillatoriales cyanobacterium]|nr:MAG: hypothetical protein EA001_14260 [Oscillatoriales cyanobacterium]